MGKGVEASKLNSENGNHEKGLVSAKTFGVLETLGESEGLDDLEAANEECNDEASEPNPMVEASSRKENDIILGKGKEIDNEPNSPSSLLKSIKQLQLLQQYQSIKSIALIYLSPMSHQWVTRDFLFFILIGCLL